MVAMTPSREEKMFLWPEAFSELKTPTIQEVSDPISVQA